MIWVISTALFHGDGVVNVQAGFVRLAVVADNILVIGFHCGSGYVNTVDTGNDVGIVDCLGG